VASRWLAVDVAFAACSGRDAICADVYLQQGHRRARPRRCPRQLAWGCRSSGSAVVTHPFGPAQPPAGAGRTALAARRHLFAPLSQRRALGAAPDPAFVSAVSGVTGVSVRAPVLAQAARVPLWLAAPCRASRWRRPRARLCRPRGHRVRIAGVASPPLPAVRFAAEPDPFPLERCVVLRRWRRSDGTWCRRPATVVYCVGPGSDELYCRASHPATVMHSSARCPFCFVGPFRSKKFSQTAETGAASFVRL